MFPGRFPNVPDTMWNFGWSPQPMGLQGQFCGGDVMNQQSQAQSQAQTQAQLAHLREQNSILNQQLASQAQSHIQHLQQLLPFHQSTSTPSPPQPTPQVSEPPPPVAPPSTQPGSSVSFNPEEMMQQMKNTVESSIQRSINQLPSPSQAPIPVPPQSSSHLHPPDDAPTFHHRSHRRSRSQRHRSASRRPDKRPISIPRSPRRHKSPRRTRRSSRPRSSSRRRLSTSRRPSRAMSITLRSASPRHREGRHRDQDDHQPQEPTHTPATLQPATWEHHPQQSYYSTNTQSNYYHYDQHTTNKWQSRGQWKDYYSKSSNTSNASGWIDYTKPISDHSQYNSSTKPLTVYSSDHNNPPRQPPHRSGSLQSRGSTNVPPRLLQSDFHVLLHFWCLDVISCIAGPEYLTFMNLSCYFWFFFGFGFFSADFDWTWSIAVLFASQLTKEDIVLCIHGGVGSFSIHSTWTKSCWTSGPSSTGTTRTTFLSSMVRTYANGSLALTANVTLVNTLPSCRAHGPIHASRLHSIVTSSYSGLLNSTSPDYSTLLTYHAVSTHPSCLTHPALHPSLRLNLVMPALHIWLHQEVIQHLMKVVHTALI